MPMKKYAPTKSEEKSKKRNEMTFNGEDQLII